jgi:hypothetical protein
MKNNKNTIKKITVGCSSIHPYFVTGFTDAEGCFYVGVVRRLILGRPARKSCDSLTSNYQKVYIVEKQWDSR